MEERVMKPISFAFVVLALFIIPAFAGPAMMDYQGYFEENGVPMSGNHSLAFALYSQMAGGDSLWSEIQSDVPFDRGLFNVKLGTVNPLTLTLFQRPEVYLAVRIDGNGFGTRTQLASVPYAFLSALADEATHAADADNALHAVYADSAGSAGGGDSHWAQDGNNIYNTNPGNVGIGTSTPGDHLQVVGAGSVAAISGFDTNSNTNTFGVYGETTSGTNGVPPGNPGAGDAVGVYGRSRSANSASGGTIAVLGVNEANTTVPGSHAAVGVYGQALGVPVGTAPGDFDGRCVGVFGESWSVNPDGAGIIGMNHGTTGNTRGVWGSVNSPTGRAIYGDNVSPTGFAGWFNGNVHVVAGDLTVRNKDISVCSSTRGLILKSPDGTCFRVQVNNSGALTVTEVTCPNCPD